MARNKMIKMANAPERTRGPRIAPVEPALPSLGQPRAPRNPSPKLPALPSNRNPKPKLPAARSEAGIIGRGGRNVNKTYNTY
jgi:hypothetical protein